MALTIRSTEASSVMSVGHASAFAPAARASSTNASSSDRVRAATATEAPASRRPWAIDRPRPRPAPVTMATLSRQVRCHVQVLHRLAGLAADQQPLDLVGAVVDLGDLGVPQATLDADVHEVAVRTEELGGTRTAVRNPRSVQTCFIMPIWPRRCRVGVGLPRDGMEQEPALQDAPAQLGERERLLVRECGGRGASASCDQCVRVGGPGEPDTLGGRADA